MRLKLLVLVVSLLMLQLVSAEVMISQPKAVYNINDMLDISATVKATQDLDSFVELSLVCGNFSKTFYLSPISLLSGQQESISKKLLLSNSFLQGAKGICAIMAKFDSASYYGQSFKISDNIIVSVTADKTLANPGENIVLKGTAAKDNGQNAEGFVEATVQDTGISLKDSVSQGKFQLNFSFPENQKSGNYNIEILAYEKSKEEITNQGSQAVLITVNQVPKKLDIATDKTSIIPGSSIKFKPLVYDQADDLVTGEISLEVIDSNGNSYWKNIVKTSEETELKFAENTTSGLWEIAASGLGLASIFEFTIEPLEKASFSILNNTLTITNIGNQPYRKPVQVMIGENTEVLEMNLDLGEERQFELTGDGNYDVSISDGTEEASLQGVSLTGGVIGVRELRSGLGLINKYPLLWVFLIGIFGLFVFTLSQRAINKKYFGYVPKEEKKGYEKVKPASELIKENKEEYVKAFSNVKHAETSLVLQGKKEEASVISVKIKKASDKNSIDTITNAVERINDSKGTLQRVQDGWTGIFVPSVTRTFKNDLTAVRVASEIASSINEHNRKFKDKIDYGIGIHSGELATKLEQGKLKFTPLGNTISFAKKVADTASNTVLVSKETNKKVMNDVKTLKQGDFYSISRIIEREQNKDFLNKFKERNQLR